MSGALFTSPAEIRASVLAAERARGELLRVSDEELVRALERALGVFLDPASTLGREARSLIPASSRLSPAMVEWALTASVGRVHAEGLRSLLASRPAMGPGAATPRKLHVVVLAQNVFTASIEPILCSLLARVPVVAKASSRDDVFARLIEMAWRDAAPSLEGALRTLTFPGGDEEREAALLDRAEVVTVYGHDSTAEAITERIAPGTALVPRGTGLGAAFVGKDALSRGAAGGVAEALALDVAAYDQRGCLSPHTIFVEEGGETSPEVFARLVAERGLEPLRSALPRGPLDMDEGTAQMRWRALALTRGGLLEGDGYAVSFECDEGPRVSPGFRNVQVLAARDWASFTRAVLPFGRHLKAVGVAGVDPDAARTALPGGVAPRLSRAGAMQRPPLDGFTDGGSRWEGLFLRASGARAPQ